MGDERLRARLLVASPTLVDPNFFRTVVLVLEHGDAGALGLVLNRPSETGVEDALPRWAPWAAPPGVVFVGGPVSPDSALCLGRVRGDMEAGGWERVLGQVGTVDLHREPDEIVPRLDGVRVFAGYAAWAPGQLEDEIRDGGWFVVAAEPDDVLSSMPDDLWRAVLRRQRGRLAMVANFPLRPSLN